MGKIFIPVAWLMGVPSQECGMVGDLVALKTIVNEFAAYRKLAGYIAEGVISVHHRFCLFKKKFFLTPLEHFVVKKRSQVIATYALCGFSNPGSIGIQLAVFGAMAPTRKADQAQVAFRAFISGSVACFMTACIAGKSYLLLSPISLHYNGINEQGRLSPLDNNMERKFQRFIT